MDYKETIEYLFKQLPMFHRVGAPAYKADLKNITALTEHLGHPERKLVAIHIAGTNGKGSVSNMLASILQESGYKTGLFTSPHLTDFRERIRINGKMIPEGEVINYVEANQKNFEEIQPSFFEWATSLAFYYFVKEETDVAVIETGLGGRLDSTNIITPVLSIITNISYDHMKFLGDTLEKIAGEKAGIIKDGIPVVIGERQKETDAVFVSKANEKKSGIVFASDHYKAEFLDRSDDGQTFRVFQNGQNRFEKIFSHLSGIYQSKNICTVLQSVELLKNKLPNITDANILEGLKNVLRNTGFRGRWQVIGKNPLIVADIGHNEAGIRFVAEQLSKMNYDRLHIVFGMVNDKEVSTILSLMPKDAAYYFCKANLPRALDELELKKIASGYGLIGQSYPTVASAFEAAKKEAGEKDVVFVGGSTFVVAEVLELFPE